MPIWKAVFLGAVQGLTEFLPVSSSGHLVFFESFLGVKTPGVTFEVALHVGTLLAVLWVYAADLRRMVAALLRSPATWWDDPDARTALLVLVATVPTGVIALLFKPVFEAMFKSLTAVAGFWLLSAAILWYADERQAVRGKGPGAMTVGDALFIGALQGAAVAPGLSRSGVTLASGLVRGVERTAAARFSFLLAIPAITGAAVLSVKDISRDGGGIGLLPLAVGAATAAVTGVVAIRFLLRVLQAGRLRSFAYYLGVMGLGVLAWRLAGR